MRRETEKKTLCLARHILNTGDTVRKTAAVFMMSKSAVHKLLHTALKELHPGMYEEVMQVMAYHQAVRHLRGGEATREKYRLLREQKQKNS